MTKVISIYQAKTNLSKLIKQASAGKQIYVGAYGRVQAVITAPPSQQKLNIGIWKHKRKQNDYNDSDLINSDPEINQIFKKSLIK